MILDISTKRESAPIAWDAKVAEKMDRLQNCYFNQTEIPLKLRRKKVYRALLELDDFTPDLAKVAIQQWNDIAASQGIDLRRPSVEISVPKIDIQSLEPVSKCLNFVSDVSIDDYLPLDVVKMPLGELLIESELIARYQLDIALMEQSTCKSGRIGEILARHGWIKQQTADFFSDKLPFLSQERQQQPLGYYMKIAALLDYSQLCCVMQEQERTGLRFGDIVVGKGWVPRKTVQLLLSCQPELDC